MTRSVALQARGWTGALALFAAAQVSGLAAAEDLDLALPRGAKQTYQTVQDPGTYALPTGVFRDGRLPVARIEGRVTVESWRVPNTGLTAFQLAQPLRDAYLGAGFETRLDCEARACGGFDFRFATLVLPAPEMFVSLDDFHFVSMRAEGRGAVSVLTSRDASQGYVQIIRVAETRDAALSAALTATAPPVAPVAPVGQASATGSVAERLERDGHVVLTDLLFRPGSSDLGDGAVASLDALAGYLAANPGRRVLFVGHTDATGSLEANRRVSRRRAEAALGYLRDRHNTPAAQIGAEGAGYLSPVATNLTPEGREANRRVEVILLSTE